MRVGIVGFGIVGNEVNRAILRAAEKDGTLQHPVRFDIKEGFSATKKEFNDNVDIAFICVPTPTNIGNQDLTAIKNVLNWLTVKNVCIRSTILPGTTEKLSKSFPEKIIVYSPEFIGENPTHPYSDFSPFQVIGFDTLQQQNLANIICDLYALGYPDTHVLHAPTRDAEFFKYTCNIFLAMKVIFSNLMAEEAVTRGVDWDRIQELMAFDKRIGNSHTTVTLEGGFGGSCLPKDLDAFRGMLFQVNPTVVNDKLADFLSLLVKLNNKIRR